MSTPAPANVSGTKLNQPNPANWDKHNETKKVWQAPPVPLDAQGNRIIFTGTMPPKEGIIFGETQSNYRNYRITPITVEKPTGAGYQILNTFVNLVPWTGKGEGMSGGSVFVAAVLGPNVRPVTNDDYDKALLLAARRPVQFTATWEARNRDTGEEVKGYLAFPEELDAEGKPTGKRKAILKQGDEYYILDKRGNRIGTERVRAEALFANLVVDRFVSSKK